MKKYVLISFLICSAALLLPGCSTVGSTEESSASESADETMQPSSEEELAPAETPTDRVPDIQTSDEFEYEIIDGGAVITAYTGNSTEVVIPDALGGAPVTEIGFYAFEARYDITDVTLPDTVTLIGEGAFMDCSSLESVNIPEAVTGIDRGAFVACTSLSEITLPESVQYVREEAFTACESMTSLTIENPELAYENWGLEELPELSVYAPYGSAAAEWAESIGKLS